MIDTGAERTSVSDSLARSLDLPIGPDVLVHGITAAERVPTVTVPSLVLLRRPFENVIAPVFARDLLAADGFLGLDVLSRFRLTLDFGRRRAFLAPSGQRRLYGGVGLDAPSRIVPGRGARRMQGGQLLMTTVRIGDAQVDAFIDSGAQYSIGNRQLAGLAGPAEGEVELFGVTGQSLAAEKRTIRNLRIGERRFGEESLLFADLHAFRPLGLMERPALLLGADLLTRFRRILLDYGAGRVALEP